ncbi:uncharacterized protein DMENIID0001_099820 [Sergentomyia squamirostris]
MSSLVSYDYSSDEDNDSDQEVEKDKQKINSYEPTSSKAQENLEKTTKGLVFNLPTPTKDFFTEVAEEEDEFLKIKATPTEKPPEKRGPVKISIPSLSEFKDVGDTEEKEKPPRKSKISSLLSILPKPISETLFQAPRGSAESIKKQKTLVPDSVLNRQAKMRAKPVPAAKKDKKEEVESDDSDTGDDFFRLNTTEELPEVSKNELNVLVAKKKAQIAATSSRFEKESEIGPRPNDAKEEAEIPYSDPREITFDDTAMEKLCGKRAKRARMEEINFVDIRGDQVMPSQEEWMRQALANSTELPKGKPAAGSEGGGLSKRKHQITYLAHQAKSNEQELQAMWAANRQSRRQTQSKYGF